MYLKNKISKLLIITILIENIIIIPIFADDKQKNNARKENKAYTKAIEFSIGKFHPGPYAPYQISKNKWNNCNSMNLCNINKVFGNNIGAKYIKRYIQKNNHNIDIDTSLTYGSQNYKKVNRNFFMLSIIPTYRYKLNNKTTLGIGTGMSISSAKIPSESRKTGKINSQINLEIGFQFDKKDIKKKTELVLALNHRCTFFGIIGGTYSSSQWYMIGIREWI